MEDTIAFARDFIKKEHDALLAELLERDIHVFEQKRMALENMASFPGFTSSIYRPIDETLPSPEQASRQLETQAAPRRLLKIERYDNPRYGDLYAATFTSTFGPQPPPRPALRLLIAHLPEAGWQIVAREGACFLCEGSGTFEGRICTQCGGVGWENTGGERLILQGKPVETRIFEGEPS
jgi:hypothetical protein